MKQKATWNDIDRCLSNGNLEDQDYDTLLSFSRVSPPPSNNPAFHVKFQNTQNRIIERIRQIDREKKAFPESAADIVIIGGMGLRFDDYQAFIDNAETSGSLDKTIMFIHKATDPAVECMLVPDMALACAERFAVQDKNALNVPAGIQMISQMMGHRSAVLRH